MARVVVHLTRRVSAGLAALAILGTLAACAPPEVILPGERLDLRAPLAATGAPVAAVPEPTAVPVRLPAAMTNSEWTHRGGGVQHKIANLALAASLTPVWTASIGAGDTRKVRVTADPVVAGGRVFTLDAQAMVAGFATNGTALWTRDLTPASESAGDASGGGLAYGGNRLFATTGFGDLAALDPATGAVLWTQSFAAPVSAAPTVEGNLVYLVAEDSSAWAVNAETGRVVWQLPGTPAISGMVGGPGPALTDRLVILPFSSGEIVGALKASGLQIWAGNVAGRRLGRAFASTPDITADPVVVGDVIYVGTQSGKVAALDASSGEPHWTATEGALSPILPVATALYLVSDEARLVRLDAATGALVWAVDLPYFTADKIRKRKDVYGNYGPILAGGRLIVASGDGQIRQFDPASGALLGAVALPGGAASNPVVAGATLYVVSTDGKLHAFR